MGRRWGETRKNSITARLEPFHHPPYSRPFVPALTTMRVVARRDHGSVILFHRGGGGEDSTQSSTHREAALSRPRRPHPLPAAQPADFDPHELRSGATSSGAIEPSNPTIIFGR